MKQYSVNSERSTVNGQALTVHRSLFTDFVLGFAALALYTSTLAPGLLPADAGEYQLASATLGVAHPPGYALYTVAGWLISRLPFASPATTINVLSALLAAFTLVFVSRAVRAMTGSAWAGLGAAAMLGLSTTFWAQATTANVRMPAAFAVAWAVERLAGLTSPPDPLSRSPHLASGEGGHIAWLAFALGLAVSHHGSTVFLAAVVGLYALSLTPGVLQRPWPRLAVVTLAGLLPFLAWLYFPLNALYLGGPPALATWEGFLEHVLARGFRGDLFFFATPDALPDRLRVLGVILPFQWNWVLLAFSALGAVRLFTVHRSLFTALLAAFSVHTFVAITYRAPQTAEYLLPSYVLMALAFGAAVAALLRARALARLAGGAAIVAALGFQFAATYPAYRALAADDGTRAFTQSLLDHAPRDSVVLAPWHWSTPLWYLQQVEGARPDVETRYVVPRTDSYGRDWVDAIQAALPARPVVVTSFFQQELGSSGLRFIPLPTAHSPAWLVSKEPLTVAPPALTGAQDFEAVDFLGYQIVPTPSATSVIAPAAESVAAAWRVDGPPRDISFFVHLIGPDGLLYGQMDVNYPASRYERGEVLFDRYTLDVLPDAAPGAYTLMAGAYTPDGARIAETALTTIEIATPPSVAPGTSFGGRLALTQSSFTPATARPGDTVTIEAEFVALRPITEDLIVSVTLAGEGWRAQADTVPVGGALPTLKWITGSRLRDRYTLTVPAHARPGPATLSLNWYDAFTQRNLPVLDRDLAQRGPGVPLGIVTVVP
jgi:hypothetical protein